MNKYIQFKFSILITSVFFFLTLVSCATNTETHNASEYTQAVVTGGTALIAKAIDNEKKSIPDKSKVILTVEAQVVIPVECYLSTNQYRVILIREEQEIFSKELSDNIKKIEIRADTFSNKHQINLVNINQKKIVDSKNFTPDSKQDKFSFSLLASCEK